LACPLTGLPNTYVLERLKRGHEAVSSTLHGLVQAERFWIVTQLISQGIEILACDLPRLLVTRQQGARATSAADSGSRSREPRRSRAF
jgi:hypothetical protein